jgi:hypothetical protein
MRRRRERRETESARERERERERLVLVRTPSGFSFRSGTSTCGARTRKSEIMGGKAVQRSYWPRVQRVQQRHTARECVVAPSLAQPGTANRQSGQYSTSYYSTSRRVLFDKNLHAARETIACGREAAVAILSALAKSHLSAAAGLTRPLARQARQARHEARALSVHSITWYHGAISAAQ